MSEDFNNPMGYDPSNLSIFKEKKKSEFLSEYIYKPKPSDSVSKNGIYSAQIKIINNPFNREDSVVERQSYWMEDKNGGFEAVSSLTNNDTSCPIFSAWKKCHYETKNTVLHNQAVLKKDGGNEMFNKRYARYVLIQVLKDDNHPELEHRFMIWKCPKFIWEAIEAKIKPQSEAKASVPVMDFLFGKAIDLVIKPGDGPVGSEKYNRDTSYNMSEITEDIVSVTDPEGNSVLSDDEQEILDAYVAEIKKVWKEKDPEKRAELNKTIVANENTKKLSAIYTRVWNQLKEWCPNIREEVGYKPWNEALTQRVQAWIDVVLSGENPAVGNNTTKNDSNKGQSEPKSALEPQNPVEDDGLPF